MRCEHTMPFGTRLAPSGGVDFRLWAPAARAAELLFYPSAGGRALVAPAIADREGWWSCHVPEAAAGSLYHWRIDGSQRVPDPASRQNPRGVHQPSAVVDPLQFEWDADWRGRPWNEVVLYEMHVGAFTPEGTFIAAGARLQELKDLGVTAVQLMPLADFPGRFGWGYDGVLPFAPNARYGTPDELKHFIQQAHHMGLMVFVDVVYNHFGPQGNYLPGYAPQFFSTTHASPWGQAINFDGEGSRTVRDFFIHNALYWVQEYRVDGLRMDAVHAISDTSRPHILEEISCAVRQAAGSRHVHLVLENENNEAGWLATTPQAGRYDAQWNDDFHHALHVALTGEARGYYLDYAGDPVGLLQQALTHGMVFAHSGRKPGGAREHVQLAAPQPLGALVNFAHNHDQVGNRGFGERLSHLVPQGARELPTLLALLSPCVPMLFFGEEHGAPQPFLYFADWEGELRDAVRQGRQREFAAFARAAGGEDALPDPCSTESFEASRPLREQRDSEEGRRWLALVRAALEARRRFIAPRHALLQDRGHTAQRIGPAGLAVQWRYSDGQVLCLELNLSAQPLQVPPEHAGPVEARDVFSHNFQGTPRGTWPAWSARWTLGEEITN